MYYVEYVGEVERNIVELEKSCNQNFGDNFFMTYARSVDEVYQLSQINLDLNEARALYSEGLACHIFYSMDDQMSL